MRVRQQSTATYAIPLYMVLSSDHVSAATGKTVSVTLSKNGGAFAAASGAVTELSSGVYSLAGNATDSNTLGSLTILATATGCDPYLAEYTIVPYNPFDAVRLGLTALPNAAAEAAGGLYTRGTGAGQINQPANGRIDVNTIALSGTTQTARDIGASVLLSSGTGTGQVSLSSGTVTVGTNNDKTGYTASTVTDKTGYALSSAGVQAIWDALTSALSTASSIGKLLVDNINATISSRSTLDGTGVQSALTSQGYTTTRAGYLDTLNGLVQAVWDKATSAITTAGSIGKLLVDNVDAAISSRLASAGYTTPPTVVQVRQEMDANSTKLANLDAAVSTRSTLTAAGVWDALLTGITTIGSVGKLIKDYLDAAVSTRLASASYTAPLNSTQTAQAVLDATASSYNTASTIGEKINSASAPSAAAVADAVWDEAISGHLTAGTTGAKLNSAAAAGDPWSTALPGSYASGEAGNILAAIKTKTDTIVGSSITVTSPIVEGADITIVKGDDYANADGRALFATTTFSNAPSLTGGSVTLKVQTGATTTFSKTGVVTGAAACYVELTDAETAALTGKRSYDLEATLSNGDIVTIAQGKLEVLKDVR